MLSPPIRYGWVVGAEAVSQVSVTVSWEVRCLWWTQRATLWQKSCRPIQTASRHCALLRIAMSWVALHSVMARLPSGKFNRGSRKKKCAQEKTACAVERERRKKALVIFLGIELWMKAVESEVRVETGASVREPSNRNKQYIKREGLVSGQGLWRAALCLLENKKVKSVISGCCSKDAESVMLSQCFQQFPATCKFSYL